MNIIPKIFNKNSFTLCPLFIGQKLYGPSKVPNILSNKLKQIPKYNDFTTYNLKFNNSYDNYNYRQNLSNVLQYNKTIYNSNKKTLDKHILNINIGGDHSIAIGSVTASLEKYQDDLVLIWIDAHADINSFKSSRTKNIHGIPLDILTKSPFISNFNNKLKYNQLIYIGLRDCDDYEIKLINDNHISNFTSNEINSLDIFHQTHLFNLLNEITYDKKIHLSLDVDALDPKYILCTGTPVSNGLSMDFVTKLISSLKHKIINADIVELNLDLETVEDQEKSLNNTLELISSFF